MGKGCCYPQCKHDSRKLKISNPDSIFFIPFPKPNKKLEKCIKWISSCCKPDRAQEFLSKITKNSYVCSKHFAGGNGPTPDHPDPITAFPERVSQQNITLINQVIPPVGWLVEHKENGSCVFFKKRKEVIVQKCTVQKDLKFNLVILNSPAEESVINMLPKLECLDELPEFLKKLNCLKICTGNTEDRLVQAFSNCCRIRKGGYKCKDSGSVYSINCKRIANSSSSRCSSCTIYRKTLRCSFNNKTRRIKKTMQEIMSKYPSTSNRTRKRLRDVPLVIQEPESSTSETSNGTSSVSDLQISLCEVEDKSKGFRSLLKKASYMDEVLPNEFDRPPETVPLVEPDILPDNPLTNIKVECVLKVDNPDSSPRISTNKLTENGEEFKYILPVASCPFPCANDIASSKTWHISDNLVFPRQLYSQILRYELPSGWTCYMKDKDLIFIKLESDVVVMSLVVDFDLKLALKIHGDELSKSHCLYKMLSAETVSTIDGLLKIVQMLNYWKTCRGCNETIYIEHFLTRTSVKDCKLFYQTKSLYSQECHLLLSPNEKSPLCIKCSLLKRRLEAAIMRRKQNSVKNLYSYTLSVTL